MPKIKAIKTPFWEAPPASAWRLRPVLDGRNGLDPKAFS